MAAQLKRVQSAVAHVSGNNFPAKDRQWRQKGLRATLCSLNRHFLCFLISVRFIKLMVRVKFVFVLLFRI